MQPRHVRAVISRLSPTRHPTAVAAAVAILSVAGCGGGDPAANNSTEAGHAEGEAGHKEGEAGHSEAEGAHKKGESEGGGEEGTITLTAQQIRAAGIEIVRPVSRGGGTLQLPATIEGDPQGGGDAIPVVAHLRLEVAVDAGESELASGDHRRSPCRIRSR